MSAGLDPASRGLLRWAAAVASPGSGRARLPVLIYHRVLARPDPLLPDICDRQRFEWQMRTVSEVFRVLPLAEAIGRLRDGSLPARAVSITFDDGYADNVQQAMPILQRYRLPATFFVASGYLDGGIMFNDVVYEVCRRLPPGARRFAALPDEELHLADAASRRDAADRLIACIKYQPGGQRAEAALALAEEAGIALPDDLMMRSEDIGRLAQAGMEIGGHTVTHPILAGLDAAAAEREMRDGRDALRALSGQPVSVFAYPNGRPGKDYRHAHVEAVRRSGYQAAVSTAWGTANRRFDPFQIPRIAPWDRSPRRFVARVIKACIDPPAERV